MPLRIANVCLNMIQVWNIRYFLTIFTIKKCFEDILDTTCYKKDIIYNLVKLGELKTRNESKNWILVKLITLAKMIYTKSTFKTVDCDIYSTEKIYYTKNQNGIICVVLVS